MDSDNNIDVDGDEDDDENGDDNDEIGSDQQDVLRFPACVIALHCSRSRLTCACRASPCRCCVLQLLDTRSTERKLRSKQYMADPGGRARKPVLRSRQKRISAEHRLAESSTVERREAEQSESEQSTAVRNAANTASSARGPLRPPSPRTLLSPPAGWTANVLVLWHTVGLVALLPSGARGFVVDRPRAGRSSGRFAHRAAICSPMGGG